MRLERQFGEVRASSDDRKVKFIFSTGAKDRHGTRINPRGWVLDNFNKNGVASFQHRAYGDPDPDMIIGKASAWVTGDRLVGTIDFEPEEVNPLAEKLYRKVKAGTLNAVSVGFLEKEGHWGKKDAKEEEDTYYFDSVELMEISLVTVPSNPEALAQRSFEVQGIPDNWVSDYSTDKYFEQESLTDLTQVTKSINMEEKEKDLPQKPEKVEVEVKIDASALNEAIEKLTKVITPADPLPGPPAVDITEKEKKNLSRYSLRKAILQKAFPEENGKLDGIELEMHQEAVKEGRDTGKHILGLGVPSVQLRADLQTGAAAAGGNLVQTDVIDFIGSLRNSMATIKAGARLMTGLQGDVQIPSLSTDSTAAWRTEIGVATQADPAFGTVTMTPHRVTTYTTFSKQLLRQTSYDVENIVRDSLFYAVANALETAALEGDGASQVPTGILNASNVNDATHGSTAPTLASWANIITMESMIAVDNALAAEMAFVLKATAAAQLKKTARDSVAGGYIWENDPLLKGTIDGYPAFVTNVFTNDTVIFGNWRELYFGQWGGIDLLVNPYVLDTSARIRVVISGYYDVAVAHGQSFSRIDDLKLT